MNLFKYIFVFVFCSVTAAASVTETFGLKLFVDGEPITIGEDAFENSVYYNIGQNVTFVCNSFLDALFSQIVHVRVGCQIKTIEDTNSYSITATVLDNDSMVYCSWKHFDRLEYECGTLRSSITKLIMNLAEPNITIEERTKKISILKEQYLQELRKAKNDSDANGLWSSDISGKKIETTDTVQNISDVTGIETNPEIVTKVKGLLNKEENKLEADDADDDGLKFVDILSLFQKLTDSRKKNQLTLVKQKTTVEIREID